MECDECGASLEELADDGWGWLTELTDGTTLCRSCMEDHGMGPWGV